MAKQKNIYEMASFLTKVNLFKKMTTNQIYSGKNKQFFHTNYGLFQKPTFNEKAAKLKAFKLKQAAMQKDDGLPVYLKKGLPDKIFFNLTLGMSIAGLFTLMVLAIDMSSPSEED